MSVEYVREKFSKAVYDLGAAPEGIKARLVHAYSHNIVQANPPKGVSKDIARRIEALHAAMTNKPAEGSEGTIAATVAQMSDEQASKMAQEIVSIAFDIEEEAAQR